MYEAPAWRRLYSTRRWTRLSRAIRAASGHRCWIIGCERPATQVDHIVTPAELAAAGQIGRFFDLSILRPSCRFHNWSADGQIERNRQIEAERRLFGQEAAHEEAERARSAMPRIY